MTDIKKILIGLTAFMICVASCEEKEDIGSPNDLNVSSITSRTALLGWGGIGDEYEIKTGDSHWTTAKRSLALKDLSPDTEIRWSIRAIKGSTSSEWTEHAFQTLPLPAKPTGLKANVSYRSAELSWIGEGEQYAVKIGAMVYIVSSANCLVDELTPSTTYTWNVRTIRGIDSSDWVQTDFTTLANPAAPANLAVAASFTSARFTWSGNEQTYELRVGTNTYTVDGKEYTLNNLTAGMQYTWAVRAILGDGIYSEWSESTFSTQTVPVQISINNLNVAMAEITITPDAGRVSAYTVLLASKELYQEFVDAYTDGDEVAFLEIAGEPYETNAPLTEVWELNGAPDYTYYAAVLLYKNNGEPYLEVVKHEFTSPAYQAGLPEASVTVSVSEVTATSARIVFTPDANALGFYGEIFPKALYDEVLAIEGENYTRDYLAAYGYLFLTTNNGVWEPLDSATEYIVVALPFNANGTAGYGALVTQTFTTLAGNGAPSIRSAKRTALYPREQKIPKKAVTAESIKALIQKKKK